MQNFEETIALNADVVREINKECEKKIEQLRAHKNACEASKSTDIKDVGAGVLFSNETFWQVINLKTLAEFEISGTATAFYLTNKPSVREMLEQGEINAFKHKDFYIRFKCGSRCRTEQNLERKKSSKNKKT